jgi:hypothetical protein
MCRRIEYAERKNNRRRLQDHKEDGGREGKETTRHVISKGIITRVQCHVHGHTSIGLVPFRSFVTTMAYSPASLVRNRSHFVISMVNVEVVPLPLDLSSASRLDDRDIFTLFGIFLSLPISAMAQQSTIPVN